MHRSYVFTFCFDFVFSTLVILNLVVFVWRIIWDTQDIYLESNEYLNPIVSVLISLVILVLVKIVQMKNARNFSMIDDAENGSTAKKPARQLSGGGSVIRRHQKYGAKLKVFILVFSFANINLWRGIWMFTLHYTNGSAMGMLMIALISGMALIAMNRVCALVALPFIYAKDGFDSAYQINPNTTKTKVCLKIEQELNVIISLKIDSNLYGFAIDLAFGFFLELNAQYSLALLNIYRKLN
jgi:hypothetical protein